MITMREAKKDDIFDIYWLSNDPSIREASLASENILLDTHIKWFLNKIIDPDIIFLLFFEEKKLISQIRFELKNVDLAEVSISIDHEYRNRGIGKELLTQAIEFASKRWKLKTIKAVIKKENERSKRFFIKFGFNYYSQEKINNFECDIYIFAL
ncbi:MAG: GNAT family N-acetyltransferase [Candidatus Zixiibacteriota bacterium]